MRRGGPARQTKTVLFFLVKHFFVPFFSCLRGRFSFWWWWWWVFLLKSRPDVDGRDVVVGVSEALGVFVDFVGGGRDGQRLFQLVAHGQRQFQVLLHVLQRHRRRERPLQNRCKATLSSSTLAVHPIPTVGTILAVYSVLLVSSIPTLATVLAVGSILIVRSRPYESTILVVYSIPSVGSIPTVSSIYIEGTIPSEGSVLIVNSIFIVGTVLSVCSTSTVGTLLIISSVL